MERVYHIDIVQIRRSGLVGHIDRVGEGHIPYRESFEFGITGLDSAFVLLVQLAQTNGHLAAAGAGGRNHHQGFGGFYVIVLAEAFVRIDQGNVIRIAFNGVVVVHLDAHILQALAVCLGTGLTIEVGDNYAVDAKLPGQKFVPQAKHVHIVGNAQVASDLVLFNIYGADNDHYLNIFLQLKQHLHLTVRLETGEYAAGVVIVKEFAAKLHIQFIAEFGDAFLDVL